MKILNYAIALSGVVLIVCLSYLVSGLFEDKRVLVLDTIVIVYCYVFTLYAYGGLFVSKETFERDVPETGIKMYTLWIYCPLAILVVVLGKLFSVSFLWQEFLQMCLFFLALIGLKMSDAAVSRMTKVANKSESRHAYKNSLSSYAQQIQLAASLNVSLDAGLKADIGRLVERIGYLTPSNTPVAATLDREIERAVSALASLLNSGASNQEVRREIEAIKTILSQRLRTY